MRAAILSLLLVLIAASPAAAAELVAGDYRGLEAAEGQALSLAVVRDQAMGRLLDGEGRLWTLTGRRYGPVAEGTMAHASGVAAFRLQASDTGLALARMVIRDGEPDAASAIVLGFARGGPGAPDREPVAPPADGEVLALDLFLQSSARWSPAELARGVAALSKADMALLASYDAVAGALFLRICAAPGAMPDRLAATQGTDCATTLAARDAAAAAGRLGGFRRIAGEQTELMLLMRGCARQARRAELCQKARETALTTAGLDRDAAEILSSLTGEGG